VQFDKRCPSGAYIEQLRKFLKRRKIADWQMIGIRLGCGATEECKSISVIAFRFIRDAEIVKSSELLSKLAMNATCVEDTRIVKFARPSLNLLRLIAGKGQS
jgi:hypothetical protein